MALSVKKVLGLLVVVNIITVICFYSMSTDTLGSTAELHGGNSKSQVGSFLLFNAFMPLPISNPIT